MNVIINLEDLVFVQDSYIRDYLVNRSKDSVKKYLINFFTTRQLRESEIEVLHDEEKLSIFINRGEDNDFNKIVKFAATKFLRKRIADDYYELHFNHVM